LLWLEVLVPQQRNSKVMLRMLVLVLLVLLLLQVLYE
jgi:hypothetical protein